MAGGGGCWGCWRKMWRWVEWRRVLFVLVSLPSVSPQQWHVTWWEHLSQQQLFPVSIFFYTQRWFYCSSLITQHLPKERPLLRDLWSPALKDSPCPVSCGTSPAWQNSPLRRSSSQLVGSLLQTCRFWRFRLLPQPYHQVEENEFLLWGPWG